MSRLLVRPASSLGGRIAVPGDKSISHRALVFNSIADGRATVRGLLDAEDVGATRRCLAALGVAIDQQADGSVVVTGRTMRLDEPTDVLDCGNSGTTLRLLCGLLAGQAGHAVLTGDESLRARPMARITTPLVALGARIDGRSDGARAPLSVRGGPLVNRRLESPVASAQVRTALLLAGMQGHGRLELTQPASGRDHSERMLAAMGVTLSIDSSPGRHVVRLDGPAVPACVDVRVPGDFSSAAFLLVAALLVPGSTLVIEGVGLNPGRTGLLAVLRRMGAEIEVLDRQEVSREPMGDLRARHGPLVGVQVAPDEVPTLIDEIPVLAVAAATARGSTVITGAAELRHKESDRITATVDLIRALGGDAEELPEGMVVHGRPGCLRGVSVGAGKDHRLAMAAAVAGLVATGETEVRDSDAILTSFPGFPALLEQLRG